MMANKLKIGDVVGVVLEGGHIVEWKRLKEKPVYKVFLPIPNPPYKKTFVGEIKEKQLNELCAKGIVELKPERQHTDKNNYTYSFYELAADITPIQVLCRVFNLTQRALAERFGIPLRTVEDWSTGKRKPPDYTVRMIRTILELENKE